jgi:dTMP kinase
MQGIFVTFEGPEGSGKSTQAQRLAEALRGMGHEVLVTREPGGTPTGEAIRDILQHDSSGEPIAPECEVLLFTASRAQLVRRVILPALERGTIVLCDRFADSTVCYQGYGRGFDVERMIDINAFAIGDAVPDLTLLLDLEVGEGFRRIEERNAAANVGRDRFEREDIRFHEKVRQGYLALAARWPERYRIVDTDREQDVVAAEIWEHVQPHLPERPVQVETPGSDVGE